MTDDRIAALGARRASRDAHPARSARVLVTGVSMSALASLVSAFNVQAANNQVASTTPIQPEALVSPIESGAAPISPPTMPAPATPVRHIVEVDVIQPPTPVATTPPAPRGNSSSIGDLSLGGRRSGGGSGNAGGGLSGGGSSGSSGGSN